MKLIKLKVDFYANGFRSGVIEIPSELELYNDNQKRIYITKELVKHVPKLHFEGNWKIGNCIRGSYNCITIIRARKVNDILEI